MLLHLVPARTLGRAEGVALLLNMSAEVMAIENHANCVQQDEAQYSDQSQIEVSDLLSFLFRLVGALRRWKELQGCRPI